MDEPTTRVTVVTGPLGAGKTTLLNRWLAEVPRGDAAVIVNEFGDVGVDGELLSERAREVVELTGGCVCCATQADLLRALVDLTARVPPPPRLFIETSGVASPAGVLRAVTRGAAAPRLRLDGVVTVVDAARVERVLQSLVAVEQVASADVLVLSRADACAPDGLARAEATLAARNPAAVIARAARGRLVDDAGGDLDALLARRAEGFEGVTLLMPGGAPGRAPAHDDGIEAVSLTLDGPVDEERFGAWVESQLAPAGGRLLRMKGIVAVAGVAERVVLQGVLDQVEVTFGAPWGAVAPATRVVLIGYGLDRAALAAGLRACEA